MKAQTDYKNIDLSSNVDDAALLNLQPPTFPSFTLRTSHFSGGVYWYRAYLPYIFKEEEANRKIGEDNDLHLLKFLELSYMEDWAASYGYRSHMAVPYDYWKLTLS